MKKILSIIIIIFLLTVASLLFWVGLSPRTFSKFFTIYPAVNETAVEIGLLSAKDQRLSQATTSEPVSGTQGYLVIKKNILGVEVAKDSISRENGLSNRRILRFGQGMLFAFDKMSPQSFWMKDMFIPIDMIFFDNNWKIVLIEENLQPDSFPKIFGNNVDSQYVLEINAWESNSYGLKVGDQAIFLNK
ncbi:MAG: DUF192 domain-containing protein [bacterium]